MAATTDANGHRLSQRDLDIVSELRSLRAEFVAFQQLMGERDARYKERDEARQGNVALAFSAAKEAVATALAAQKEHDTRANGLQQKLDDQSRSFVHKEEAATRDTVVDEKLDDHKQQLVAIQLQLSKSTGWTDAMLWVKVQAVGLTLAAIGALAVYLARGH